MTLKASVQVELSLNKGDLVKAEFYLTALSCTKIFSCSFFCGLEVTNVSSSSQLLSFQTPNITEILKAFNISFCSAIILSSL